MSDLPISGNAKTFLTKLDISTDLKRPEWTVSPLEGHLSLEVNSDIPVGGVTDTHLSGSQASLLGIEGLFTGNQLLSDRVKLFKGRSKWLDGLTGFTFRKGMEQIRTKFKDRGMILILGDMVDAVEAGGAFDIYSVIQQQLGNMAVGKDTSGFISIVLTGNHNAFIASKNKIGTDHIQKMFRRNLSLEEFTDIVGALKQGISWGAIRSKWRNTNQNPNTKDKEKVAIHPLQKWYMEQLSFGDQIGIIFQKENDRVVAQAVFVDTLLENGGSEEDLNSGLNELELNKESGIGGEMAERHQMLSDEQEATFNLMIENINSGAQTIIYTHETALAQEMLIKRLVIKNGISEDEAKYITENKVLTVGGHRHTAEYDLVKPNKGTLTVRGISRQFIGPIAQAPVSIKSGLITPFTFKKPFSSKLDYPEILSGTLFHPKTEKIENVVADFDNLIASVGKPTSTQQP